MALQSIYGFVLDNLHSSYRKNVNFFSCLVCTEWSLPPSWTCPCPYNLLLSFLRLGGWVFKLKLMLTHPPTELEVELEMSSKKITVDCFLSSRSKICQDEY